MGRHRAIFRNIGIVLLALGLFAGMFVVNDRVWRPQRIKRAAQSYLLDKYGQEAGAIRLVELYNHDSGGFHTGLGKTGVYKLEIAGLDYDVFTIPAGGEICVADNRHLAEAKLALERAVREQIPFPCTITIWLIALPGAENYTFTTGAGIQYGDGMAGYTSAESLIEPYAAGEDIVDYIQRSGTYARVRIQTGQVVGDAGEQAMDELARTLFGDVGSGQVYLSHPQVPGRLDDRQTTNYYEITVTEGEWRVSSR